MDVNKKKENASIARLKRRYVLKSKRSKKQKIYTQGPSNPLGDITNISVKLSISRLQNINNVRTSEFNAFTSPAYTPRFTFPINTPTLPHHKSTTGSTKTSHFPISSPTLREAGSSKNNVHAKLTTVRSAKYNFSINTPNLPEDGLSNMKMKENVAPVMSPPHSFPINAPTLPHLRSSGNKMKENFTPLRGPTYHFPINTPIFTHLGSSQQKMNQNLTPVKSPTYNFPINTPTMPQPQSSQQKGKDKITPTNSTPNFMPNCTQPTSSYQVKSSTRRRPNFNQMGVNLMDRFTANTPDVPSSSTPNVEINDSSNGMQIDDDTSSIDSEELQAYIPTQDNDESDTSDTDLEDQESPFNDMRLNGTSQVGHGGMLNQ